jgi:subtilisin family serine protease
VNMSLGGGEPSQIVEERLIKAKEMGVACVIAAGNSGGPVQFPASSRHALAVSAIGKRGEFPDDSFHATQALQGFESREGYFPAKFSCFGPEVDVCAPGVAIVSSLPPDNFAAWDGTSMAAPHITGLAALVLAHHRDFKGPFQARDARRVERLFEIIKGSATMLPIGDASRIGAGLPDAPRALGLEAGTGARPLSEAPPVGDASVQALKKLLDLLAGANGSLHAAASAPSQKEPFRNAEVDRGPARTGTDVNVAPASAGFGPGVGFGNPGGQTLSELRDVLRRSGVL